MKISIKGLQKKIEAFNRQSVLLRDNYECQVQKHFREIRVAHTDTLQADHCFSRSNKIIFFDIRNLTCICSGCNMAKGFKNKSVDRAVDMIVKKREGIKVYEEFLKIDMSRSVNPLFSKRWWLEEKLQEAEENLIYYQKRIHG